MGRRAQHSSPSYGTSEPDGLREASENEPLLRHDSDNQGLEGDDGYESFATSDSDVQEGVRKVEAISKTWTQRSLIVAYLGYVGSYPLP